MVDREIIGGKKKEWILKSEKHWRKIEDEEMYWASGDWRGCRFQKNWKCCNRKSKKKKEEESEKECCRK